MGNNITGPKVSVESTGHGKHKKKDSGVFEFHRFITTMDGIIDMVCLYTILSYTCTYV